MPSKLKVAIVCDWLTGVGGAERVVLELHKMFPDAPIYTSQYSPDKFDWFKDADVRTGWLQKIPVGLKKFLPILRAWYFSRLDLRGYDLVISSSGAEAKGIRVSKPTIHVSYCHAPTHYYWSRYNDYLKHPGFGILDPLARVGLKLLIGPMRKWDYKAAQRPDYMIANSNYIKSQIKKYYGRDSEVIHPPVDVDRFKVPSKSKITRSGFLVAGRQTPYKRIDLAVAACTQLRLPLTVSGSGPDHKKLTKLAGLKVVFVSGLSDEEVVKYFQTAQAFIFPGIDDFGIVAVEALAAGTPVIAYKAGGALDYIKDDYNGLFFDKQSVGSLSGVLSKFNSKKFSASAVAGTATQFSPHSFHKNFQKYIAQLY